MSLGYGLHGMGRKALTLFYSLRQNGLEPDAVTFVAVLSTCSYTGLVDSGLQIFELMGKVGRLDEAHNSAKQLGVEDKKHPQYCMIYDMLGYVTINMKDAGYPKLELIEEWIYGLEE
ncbi:hypothetical protein KY285_007415 [Solanum tuberosum]|nr:hypothetical protein KY285_007415 [Solanum tuberosum]